MNDRELADKLIEMGVLHRGDPRLYLLAFLSVPQLGPQLPDGAVVRDWRVAGALMERCIQERLAIGVTPVREGRGSRLAVSVSEIEQIGEHYDENWHRCRGEAFGDCEARAIIEACVEALDE